MSLLLLDRLAAHAQDLPLRPAVRAVDGVASYPALLAAAAQVASALLDGRTDLAGQPVAFLMPPSLAYVATMLGIFAAGGTAVPLCISHPPPELGHVLDDCGATLLVTHPDLPVLATLAAARGSRALCVSDALAHPAATLPTVAASRPALLIYTSGTTGKPKGALTTHAILAAQLSAVSEAWELGTADHILHVLPLHHLHGILNALLALLYAGGTCELLPRFDPREVWLRFASAADLTLFMAVPTIYSKLLSAWSAATPDEQTAWSAAAQRLRLMVSGSAALPVSLLTRFRQISGHLLLERYGMTELGMVLGNPLHGERLAGSVGLPFPGVEVRLVDDQGASVADGQPGALEVRGASVFAGYWQDPAATAAAFTADGWFRTGDVAVRTQGRYQLLGRSSVDILKTGGFKVSALEIEESLRDHPAIAEVCVVGVADPEWGQRVAACAILHPGKSLSLDDLRSWAKLRLASYKVPTLLRLVAELPRNAMGKVQKPEVLKLWNGAD